MKTAMSCGAGRGQGSRRRDVRPTRKAKPKARSTKRPKSGRASSQVELRRIGDAIEIETRRSSPDGETFIVLSIRAPAL